jgi:hypothetical protein
MQFQNPNKYLLVHSNSNNNNNNGERQTVVARKRRHGRKTKDRGRDVKSQEEKITDNQDTHSPKRNPLPLPIHIHTYARARARIPIAVHP